MSSKRQAISRRKFLARSAKAAAGVVTATALTPKPTSAVIGANERINMAVIGIRGQGRGHISSYAGMPNVRVKTICDVDENFFPQRVKMAEEIQNFPPATEHDMRRVFEDKDIDAVSIATTNHWHALATIWACQTGKHVYVEKPASHNIWEGRKMIEASRKYNCLVQVGTQRRADRGIRSAMKFLHDGGIGKVYLARGLCLKPRGDIGKYPEGPDPDIKDYYKEGFALGNKGPGTHPFTTEYLKGVHYDLWLGPAPKRPFNRNRFHYNWHWNWDYGNGDIGNTGPHQLDVAFWGLNKNEYPVKTKSIGGYFKWDSDQQTPNTQTAVYEYADGTILQFEVRGLYTNLEEGISEGNLFFGTKGWMSIGNGPWKTYFGRKNEPGPTEKTIEPYDDPMIPEGGGHKTNFIRAVRSGKREDLTCDIDIGCMSAALPHLANISYRLGREVVFDGDKEEFVGDEEANRMLTRKYREPYVVPDEV